MEFQTTWGRSYSHDLSRNLGSYGSYVVAHYNDDFDQAHGGGAADSREVSETAADQPDPGSTLSPGEQVDLDQFLAEHIDAGADTELEALFARISQHYGSRGGDPLVTPEEFTGIYLAYRPRLQGFVRHMIGSDRDVDDLVHDTFDKAYFGLFHPHSTEFHITNLEAWLYRIAYRTTLDVLLRQARARRKRINEIPLPDDYGVPVSYSSDPALMENPGGEFEQAVVDQVVNRDTLRQALAMLEPKSRACLVLHSAHGFSLEETGKILELTPGAVKMHITRAKKIRASGLRWAANDG